MGNRASSDPDAVVFESDPEVYEVLPFTLHQVQTLRYRVGNTNRTCTLRMTKDTFRDFSSKLTLAVVDSSDGNEAKVEVRVSTERYGIFLMLAPVIFHYTGGAEMNYRDENRAYISYGCFLREGLMFVERRNQCMFIAYHYYVSDKGHCLTFCMNIQCHGMRGLFFTVHGPFEGPRILMEMQQLHAQRIQFWRHSALNYAHNALQLQFALTALQASSYNGLINNVDSNTKGDNNGSVMINNNHNYYLRKNDDAAAEGQEKPKRRSFSSFFKWN